MAVNSVVPEGRKYTRDHEWIREDAGSYLVGITDYAQRELGDVVFVDLPAVGKQVGLRDVLLQVESVKAVSDVYAPVAGSVLAVNEQLSSKPELLNSDPFGAGWLLRLQDVKSESLGSLLDAKQYEALLAEISK